MSVMREFIRGGLLHWQLDGKSPCGAMPVPENMVYAALAAAGHREPYVPFKGDCPTCIPTRGAYLAFLRNGGVWTVPWDIRPNEARL